MLADTAEMYYGYCRLHPDGSILGTALFAIFTQCVNIVERLIFQTSNKKNTTVLGLVLLT